METKRSDAHKVIFPMMMIARRLESVSRRKTTSLMKLGLSRMTTFRWYVINMLITPTTTVETKIPPPKMLLRPISPPSLVPVKAIMLEKTSGDPFPNGSKVVPAIAGERLSVLDKCSTAGQKYSDAVLLKI